MLWVVDIWEQNANGDALCEGTPHSRAEPGWFYPDWKLWLPLFATDNKWHASPPLPRQLAQSHLLYELLEKGFVNKSLEKGKIFIVLTEKGFGFLKKYSTILDFIDEFGI